MLYEEFSLNGAFDNFFENQEYRIPSQVHLTKTNIIDTI